jgi:hypothetical protein
MLLSRDQFCIFSDNFRTPLFKVYRRTRYKQAKISQNKDDLKFFFVFVGIFNSCKCNILKRKMSSCMDKENKRVSDMCQCFGHVSFQKNV